MRDPELRQRIEEALEEMDNLRENSPRALPADGWELVLELEEGGDICSYYFVGHSARCLFWLHDFHPKNTPLDIPGVTERTHLRESAPVSDQPSSVLSSWLDLALQAQYW